MLTASYTATNEEVKVTQDDPNEESEDTCENETESSKSSCCEKHYHIVLNSS